MGQQPLRPLLLVPGGAGHPGDQGHHAHPEGPDGLGLRRERKDGASPAQISSWPAAMLATANTITGRHMAAPDCSISSRATKA